MSERHIGLSFGRVEHWHDGLGEFSRQLGTEFALRAQALRRDHGITTAGWTAESLARHTQAVLQGGFVLAKAGNDPDLARESLDHLDRYIRQLFHVAEERAA